MQKDVIIIGCGLAGLTAAYLLEKSGVSSVILESRERPGGRIYTVQNEGEASVEMGATWFGQQHTHLLQLLDQLNLEKVEQVMGQHAFYEYISTAPPQLVELPANQSPTWRLKGGTQQLIDTILHELTDSSVRYQQVVRRVEMGKNGIEVKTGSGTFRAGIVVSTMPPKLFKETVTLSPKMPAFFEEIAAKTHTWMGESIKVALTYRDPFWKSLKSSSTIMSNVGPVNEMYDHSDPERGLYALKGFLNSAYQTVTKEERKNVVLNQLRRYYGEWCDDYISYYDTVWADEPFTFHPYSKTLLPHQSNGNQIFSRPF